MEVGKNTVLAEWRMWDEGEGKEQDNIQPPGKEFVFF